MEHEVHVWHVPLTITQNQQARYYELLTVAEQERAQRFHFEKHRRAYIAAHGPMRLLLARYLAKPLALIDYTSNRYGKPAVSDAIHFNLSHSHEHALLGLCRTQALGIDIEYQRRPVHGAEPVDIPAEFAGLEHIARSHDRFVDQFDAKLTEVIPAKALNGHDRGFLSLFDFFAVHGTGAVNNNGDVYRRALTLTVAYALKIEPEEGFAAFLIVI